MSAAGRRTRGCYKEGLSRLEINAQFLRQSGLGQESHRRSERNAYMTKSAVGLSYAEVNKLCNVY